MGNETEFERRNWVKWETSRDKETYFSTKNKKNRGEKTEKKQGKTSKNRGKKLDIQEIQKQDFDEILENAENGNKILVNAENGNENKNKVFSKVTIR